MVDDDPPESSTMAECDHCGCEYDRENEGLSVQEENGSWVDVCSSCYGDHVKTCQLCRRDDLMPLDVSEFIVVKNELAGSRQFPGIYRITHYPYLLCGMIGSDSLFENSVRFVNRLPRPDRTFEISGQVCKKCARNYERQFKQAYPTKESRWGYSKEGWAALYARVRRVIFNYPETVQDLQCPQDDYTWQELRDLFKLPNFKSYRDLPLLVKRRGIKVYMMDAPSRCSAWVKLSPEPRDSWNRSWIDATALPTWHKPAHFNPHYDSYYPFVLAAVNAAIDKGILTRDGVVRPIKS